MNVLSEINKQHFRSDLPKIKVGDRIEVVSKSFRPNQDDKHRLIRFVGKVIDQKNCKKISYTFSVLKKSDKVSIKSSFSYHSPLIVNIKKLGRSTKKILRARLAS
jgi:ribosomal protein L19